MQTIKLKRGLDVDWTFRLRDRRLRRWVAYGGRRSFT